MKSKFEKINPPMKTAIYGLNVLYREYDYNFGFLLRYLNDYANAAQQFERVLQLIPKLLPAKLALGFAHLEAEQVDEAVRDFTDAVRIDPHSRRAWQALAQAARLKPVEAGKETSRDSAASD